MPRGNGMGPNGMGPMSGRAAGYCSGSGVPGYLNAAPTRQGRWGLGGCGGMFGRGRGHRNMFVATGLTGWQRAAETNPEQELAFLHSRSKEMEEGLQKTRERIAELEKAGEE